MSYLMKELISLAVSVVICFVIALVWQLNGLSLILFGITLFVFNWWWVRPLLVVRRSGRP